MSNVLVPVARKPGRAVPVGPIVPVGLEVAPTIEELLEDAVRLTPKLRALLPPLGKSSFRRLALPSKHGAAKSDEQAMLTKSGVFSFKLSGPAAPPERAAPDAEKAAAASADRPTTAPASVYVAPAGAAPADARAAATLSPLAKKKKALARYSYYAELIEREKREVAEREAMAGEDAAARERRGDDTTRMHALAGGELFFWNASGRGLLSEVVVAPRKVSAEPEAIEAAADAVLAASAAVIDGGASPSGVDALDDADLPPSKRGHHLPVAIFGNHAGLLCVVVPRPERRSLYNKLVFSREALARALAKSFERARRRAGLPIETPTASGGGGGNGGGGLPNLDRPPPPPTSAELDYLWDRLALSQRIVRAPPVTDQDAPAGAISADADAVLARMAEEASTHSHFPDGVSLKNTWQQKPDEDDGLRLVLPGVDAFQTDPAVDQRATRALARALVAHVPLDERQKRRSSRFQETTFALRGAGGASELAAGAAARRALEGVLDHTGAVVARLAELHERDAQVLADLYARDLLADNELLKKALAAPKRSLWRAGTKVGADEPPAMAARQLAVQVREEARVRSSVPSAARHMARGVVRKSAQKLSGPV